MLKLYCITVHIPEVKVKCFTPTNTVAYNYSIVVVSTPAVFFVFFCLFPFFFLFWIFTCVKITQCQFWALSCNEREIEGVLGEVRGICVKVFNIVFAVCLYIYTYIHVYGCYMQINTCVYLFPEYSSSLHIHPHSVAVIFITGVAGRTVELVR